MHNSTSRRAFSQLFKSILSMRRDGLFMRRNSSDEFPSSDLIPLILILRDEVSRLSLSLSLSRVRVALVRLSISICDLVRSMSSSLPCRARDTSLRGDVTDTLRCYHFDPLGMDRTQQSRNGTRMPSQRPSQRNSERTSYTPDPPTTMKNSDHRITRDPIPLNEEVRLLCETSTGVPQACQSARLVAVRAKRAAAATKQRTIYTAG